MKVRGLVIRLVPYSDSGKIIKCLTDNAGLKSYFVRVSKTNKSHNFLQTGTFIEFVTRTTKGSMESIKECRPDPILNDESLPIPALGVWLFTIELLNKSMADDFHIPGLRKRIDQYYIQLSHGGITTDPCTPLIILMISLGLLDADKLTLKDDTSTRSNLLALSISCKLDTSEGQQRDVFSALLNRFKSHFSVLHLESLELL